MLNKIIYKFKEKLFVGNELKKVRENIVYSRPDYVNRHQGNDFLVLGTGPSLGAYGGRIKNLIETDKLIVMGTNHITPFIYPDYHAFFNRRRFKQFASTIAPEKSRVLLSVYFPESIIKKNYCGPYELFMWRKGDNVEECEVDKDGVITINSTSAIIMIMTAYVMGGRNIYVAGVDGYSKYFESGGPTHYTETNYKKQENKDIYDDSLKQWQSNQDVSLAQIKRWAQENGRNIFKFITPGEYMNYFDSKILDITVDQ